MNQILKTRLMHHREQIVLVIDRIYSRGLTTTSVQMISNSLKEDFLVNR